MSTTASTMAKTIEQKQQSWLSEKLSSQTFWVFIAVVLACVFLSLYTDSFDTTKNLYNITRNVTFVAIIALGMTLVIITGGIDLSVGSVLCLCSMVLGVTMHAGYGMGRIAPRLPRPSGCFVPAYSSPIRHAVLCSDTRCFLREVSPVARKYVVFQFGPPMISFVMGGGAWSSACHPVLYMIILALITASSALDQVWPLCLSLVAMNTQLRDRRSVKPINVAVQISRFRQAYRHYSNRLAGGVPPTSARVWASVIAQTVIAALLLQAAWARQRAHHGAASSK